jgi:peptidoglycan hydrolase-like protein with peptidoglycan-binding domain
MPWQSPISPTGSRAARRFATPWPTDDPGLSRQERRELQTLLASRGHPIGEIDGMIGANSRQAIQAEQKRLGMAVDGRPGQKLLAALRATPP